MDLPMIACRRLSGSIFRALSSLKIPLLGAAFVFASCMSTSQSKQITPGQSQFLDAIADRTVMFVSYSGSKPFCGGVYVDDNAILTANHCVDVARWCTDDMGLSLTSCGKPSSGAQKHAFMFYTYEDHKSGDAKTAMPWIAVLVKHDERADLALLYTRRVSGSVAYVASSTPRPDSIAYVIGHPRRVSYSYMQLEVIDTKTKSMRNDEMETHTRHVLELRGRVEGGTSGGGAWDTEGKLVGICLSRNALFDESYFASVNEIGTFLSE